MNDNRKILWKMLSSKLTRIVVENKDRLTRFGFLYLKKLLKEQNCDIIVINETQEKTVMKFYLIPGKKSNIPTMKEVGERMGLTKQRISYIVNKMKIKWQSLDI